MSSLYQSMKEVEEKCVAETHQYLQGYISTLEREINHLNVELEHTSEGQRRRPRHQTEDDWR